MLKLCVLCNCVHKAASPISLLPDVGFSVARCWDEGRTSSGTQTRIHNFFWTSKEDSFLLPSTCVWLMQLCSSVHTYRSTAFCSMSWLATHTRSSLWAYHCSAPLSTLSRILTAFVFQYHSTCSYFGEGIWIVNIQMTYLTKHSLYIEWL